MLDFLCDHTVRYHAPIIIIFDQPLYWKAMDKVEENTVDLLSIDPGRSLRILHAALA